MGCYGLALVFPAPLSLRLCVCPCSCDLVPDLSGPYFRSFGLSLCLRELWKQVLREQLLDGGLAEP